MERTLSQQLAEQGAIIPIGTDLVLREKSDPEAILLDGVELGAVLVEAAARYHTPLAMPLMDLELEKQYLLKMLGVPIHERATYHFSECPGAEALEIVKAAVNDPLTPRMQATVEAVAHVAQDPDLIPVGMCIGPFSLMTKLLSDPILPIAMAASGVTAEEDAEIRRVEECLELATRVILRYADAQIKAGARLMFVAEPAANKVYLSPRMIEAGSDIFERYVMRYNLRLRSLLAAWDVGLAFHCCGELTDYMVDQFSKLEPEMLSLGSSRCLWEDAKIVPEHIVLFGNLPSKRFYSDTDLPVEQVSAMAAELQGKMHATGHPFVLGTECDVLSVPGCHDTIVSKVEAMMQVPAVV